jgi:hypothetical protein
VGAARIRDVGRLERSASPRARRDALRRRRHRRNGRQASELDASLRLGPLGEDLAMLLDSRSSATPSVWAREPHCLGVKLARGERDGAAAHDRGPAGERADALADAERVAADDRHVVGRDPELARGDLSERGLEPLP